MRIALFFEDVEALAAREFLIQALCARGHAVHIALCVEKIRDQDGGLARLSREHRSLAVGQAPARADRWTGLRAELQGRSHAPADDESDGEAVVASAPKPPTPFDLRLAEAVPSDPSIAAYLRQLDLDWLLLAASPSSLSGRDYAQAAADLGVRTAWRTEVGSDGLEGMLAVLDTPGTAPPRARGSQLRPLLEAVGVYRALTHFLGEEDNRRGLYRGPLGLLRSGLGVIRAAYGRWVLPGIMALSVAPLPDGLVRDLLSDQLAPRELARLEEADQEIAKALRGNAPIIFGPWTGGVAYELLYWIPFLRWLRKHHDIDKDRVVVISRGGVARWYSGVLGRYFDLFDLVPKKRQDYLGDVMKNLYSSRPLPKAVTIEADICQEVARRLDVAHCNILSPRTLFTLFRRRWDKRAGESFLERYTQVRPMEADTRAAAKWLPPLPERYVAINFFFTEQLPDTPANRALISQFVARLSERIDVYLIEPFGSEEGPPAPRFADGPRIHRVGKDIKRSEVLAVNSAVIAGAKAVFGTRGGMTALAPRYGQPAIEFLCAGTEGSSAFQELDMAGTAAERSSIYKLHIEDANHLHDWIDAKML